MLRKTLSDYVTNNEEKERTLDILIYPQMQTRLFYNLNGTVIEQIDVYE